ncbi:MAG: hypothetical protein HY264_11235 [Chloroflexi bacterium]|nr:hypothetical protein [Chloroflexota bacterium]
MTKATSARAAPTTTAGRAPTANAVGQAAVMASQTQVWLVAMPLPPEVTSAHGFQALTDRYG